MELPNADDTIQCDDHARDPYIASLLDSVAAGLLQYWSLDVVAPTFGVHVSRRINYWRGEYNIGVLANDQPDSSRYAH